MPDVADHRKLLVWQEAIKLVEMVYRETSRFPLDELYGLQTQMRRSAVSIPANIAEGAGRTTLKELLHSLGIASGSRAELDTHLHIAYRLGYVAANSELVAQLDRVARLLTGLRKSLKRQATS